MRRTARPSYHSSTGTHFGSSGSRSASTSAIKVFSMVQKNIPRIERALDASDKLVNVANFTRDVLGHDHKPADVPKTTDENHSSVYVDHDAAPVTATKTTVEATTVTPHQVETTVVTKTEVVLPSSVPESHHHHSGIFSELDLESLPTAPRKIHLIEMVGGKERAFVAEIVIKEEVSLDKILEDEQVLEDVNVKDLHLHDTP